MLFTLLSCFWCSDSPLTLKQSWTWQDFPVCSYSSLSVHAAMVPLRLTKFTKLCNSLTFSRTASTTIPQTTGVYLPDQTHSGKGSCELEWSTKTRWTRRLRDVRVLLININRYLSILNVSPHGYSEPGILPRWASWNLKPAWIWYINWNVVS